MSLVPDSPDGRLGRILERLAEILVDLALVIAPWQGKTRRIIYMGVVSVTMLDHEQDLPKENEPSRSADA